MELLYREGSASFEKLVKSVWRPKGRQLNKFRSMLFTILKTNCCISLSCLPSGLQSCFQAIWSVPLYKMSLLTAIKICFSFLFIGALSRFCDSDSWCCRLLSSFQSNYGNKQCGRFQVNEWMNEWMNESFINLFSKTLL